MIVYSDIYKDKNVSIHIYSREEYLKAIDFGPTYNDNVISFYNPEDLPIENKAGIHDKVKKIISIPVVDIEWDELEEFGYSYDTFLPEAEKIVDFVFEAISTQGEHDRYVDIVCQCDYGEGRSAGCAAAIIEFLFGKGIKVFSDYRYHPNKLIYHKLMDIHEYKYD